MEKLQVQNNFLPWWRWRRQNRIWAGVFLLLFLSLEFRFDIIERGVGMYLVWQNDGRQKVGRSWAVVPPEVFSRVYNSLPSFISSLIVSPDSLLFYRANGILENIVFNQSDAGLQVILLDRRNRILRNRHLTSVQMDMLLGAARSPRFCTQE